jgi:hypothetical protein
MAATAVQIAGHFGGSAVSMERLLGIDIAMLPECLALSHFLAAIHNAHYGQPADVVTAAIVSIREAFSAQLVDGPSVRLARAPPVYPILGHSVLVPRRFNLRVS